MDEYIKREAAIEAVKHAWAKGLEPSQYIEIITAADVAPVRHGRWDDEHKCTVCHNEAFFKISDIRPDYDYDWEENLVETGNYIWDTEWLETAYGPNCGADMRGSNDE